MKHLACSVSVGIAAATAGIAWVFMGAAGAEPAAGPTNVRNEVVKERTVVKTRTLYSFPERKPPEAPVAEEAPASPGAEGEYRIGPGDTLDFQLFDDDQMSREVKVRYDGHISLPLINDVKVAGMTRAEAIACLSKAYEENYKKPQLTLTVKEASSKTFFILGDVETPDEYPYERPITVLQALNIAGGPRIDTMGGDSYIGGQGRLSKAYVIRRTEGRREVHEYDLSGVRQSGENPADAPVLPGDVVYVPEGMNLVYVMGEVVNPGVYPLVEGMTVLELLARSGGAIEKSGRMRSIMLLHQVDDENTEAMMIDLRKSLDTGYSPKLRAGDIVYVPRGKLVKLYDNLMRFTRLTETVSPILSLYNLGFDAYYRDDLYDVLLDANRGQTAVSVPTSASAAAAAQP